MNFQGAGAGARGARWRDARERVEKIGGRRVRAPAGARVVEMFNVLQFFRWLSRLGEVDSGRDVAALKLLE